MFCSFATFGLCSVSVWESIPPFLPGNQPSALGKPTVSEHFPLHVSIFHSLCTSWYGTRIVYFGYAAVKNGILCICADRTSRELSYQVNINFFFRQRCRLLMAKMCSSVFCHCLTSRSDLTVIFTCTAVEKQWIHPGFSHLWPTNLCNRRPERSGEAKDVNHCGSFAVLSFHHLANLISLHPLPPQPAGSIKIPIPA